MAILILKFCFTCLLFLTTTYAQDYSDPDDVVLKFKHRLGSAKNDVAKGKIASAIEKIEGLEGILQKWKGHLLAEAEPDNGMKAKKADTDIRTSTVKLHYKVTSSPKKCKKKATKGDKLRVHYIGKLLPEKTMFDSSFHTGSMPYKFTLGGDDVLVEGWNKGLEGMCIGERRDVTIPASLAYGEKGWKKVPPNADVLFHIELVDLSKGKGEL
eukprot:g1910.t1